MRTNPCRDCVTPKRYPGCHGKCKEYKEWRDEWDAFKEEERKQYRLDAWARHDKPIRKRRTK